MTNYDHDRDPHRPDRARREGAVMIVVMLVLLAVTALAVFAAQASGFELRAAGYGRQTMQAEYVSEAGLTTTLALVDVLGPRAILFSIEQSRSLPGGARPPMAPFEPDLDASKEGYRFYSADMASSTAASGAPVSSDALGPRQVYQPMYTVDVNDQYISSQTIPGQRADGLARLHFLHATYTARGRMQLTGTDTVLAADVRQYHETASGARAYGTSGPFAQ